MTSQRTIPQTVTVHVPFRVVKRGGRKEMVLPGSCAEGAQQPRGTDNTLIKALARAFRWKRMLDAGEFATVAELAHQEGIALSYVTRLLQLTRLAPDLTEAILNGTQARILTAEALRQTLPDDWADQRRMLERAD